MTRSPCGIHLVRSGPCPVCALLLERLRTEPLPRGKWYEQTGSDRIAAYAGDGWDEQSKHNWRRRERRRVRA